jgi:phosphatidylserine decarboxylase
MQKNGKHLFRIRCGNFITHEDKHEDYLLNFIRTTVEKGHANCKKKRLSNGEIELKNLHPEVQALKDLIERHPSYYEYFHLMFDEVTNKKHRDSMPITNYIDLLAALNHLLTEPPEYNETGMVALPVNVILNWPMETKAGFAAFHDDKVNQLLKDYLDAWGKFLLTPKSCKYLTDLEPDGWFCSSALQQMGDQDKTFDEMFICNPKKKHYGFKNWDDFFTRYFREGIRPVEDLDDNDVINNACEAAPYAIAKNILGMDAFWIKGQPYSLRHIFGDDPIYEEFIGGTLYQGYLNPFRYHRWHSPVNGTIIRCWNIPGTYYAEAPYIHNDPEAPNESQGYIAQVATRAIILIEVDNPTIGLMAFIGIGMADCSTCQIAVKEGQKVRKGEEIGSFHFGGSSHCLIFKKDIHLLFEFGKDNKPSINSTCININKKLAKVVPFSFQESNEANTVDTRPSSIFPRIC